MPGSVNLTSRDGVTFTVDTGALCVDFLYTGGLDDRAQWETLHEPHDLARWVSTSGMFWGATDAQDIVVDTLDGAVELREVLWRSVNAMIDANGPSEKDIGALNRAAALPIPAPQLIDETIRTSTPVTTEHILSALARDALELVTGPSKGRVKRCAADDCAIVFVDTSRPGVRRWCSMARCGNRDKARTRRRTEKP